LLRENGIWMVDGFGCGGKSGFHSNTEVTAEYEPVEMGRHFAGRAGGQEMVMVITSLNLSQVKVDVVLPSGAGKWAGSYDPIKQTLALKGDPADFIDLQYNAGHWKGEMRLVKGRTPNGEREYASFPIEL